MIDKGVVLLQNCMDLQKDMQCFCRETCPTSRDANQIICTKLEDVSDIEEERDPVLLRYSGIKADRAVSFMSVCHC
jgi:hypothetical protein